MRKFNEPLLVIATGPPKGESDQPTTTFYSFDEIARWAYAEVEFWKEATGVVDGSANEQPRQFIWNQSIARLQKLHNLAEAAQKVVDENEEINDPSDERVRSQIEQLQRHIPDYPGAKAMLSTLPEAKFVNEISDKALAVHTYAAFLGSPESPHRALALQGMVEVYRFRHAPNDTVAPAREALEQLQSEFSKRLESLTEEFRKSIGVVEKDIEAFAQAHEAKLEQATENLTRLDNQYREDIATRHAVEYWNKRKMVHRKRAKLFAAGVALWFLVGGVSLYQMLVSSIDVESDNMLTAVGRLLKDSPALAPALVAISGLIVVLYLWVARLIVRFLLSNSHLATDASEREVATQVFLALMADESSSVAKEDRGLILQNIFRPTPTGMIKDDSAPATPVEIVLRMMEKR